MKSLPLCLLLLLWLAAPSAFPQGSLTPPGAPAPTMKTLDQVEPRKPINTASTPGDANSSFKITAPGSYYLPAPVTGVSGRSGILVEASNVTIDLHGFALTGVAGSLDGIRVASGSTQLTVRNGTITSWGEDGVDEVDGLASNGIYERIRVTGNSGDGLRLGSKSTVTSCQLEQNNGYGVSVDGRATIKDCTAQDNGLSGFYFGAGSILDSVASLNGSSGVEVFDEPVLVKNCVAIDNNDAGLRAGAGAKFSDCISRENLIGIDVGYFGAVTNCTVKNNSLGIFGGGSNHLVGNYCEGNGEGISLYENRSVLDGNQVLNGGTGIKVSGARNLLIRNMVGNNFLNFDIADDNRFGPVVDLTAGSGATGFTGNGAADTTTTTHSWANFTYAQEPP